MLSYVGRDRTTGIYWSGGNPIHSLPSVSSLMTIVIVFIGITKLPSAHKLITMVDKNGPLNDTASVGGIQKRSFCCGAGQPGVACWSMTVRCLRMNQKYFYAADHLNSVAPEYLDSKGAGYCGLSSI
jgi:hypothetical protein